MHWHECPKSFLIADAPLASVTASSLLLMTQALHCDFVIFQIALQSLLSSFILDGNCWWIAIFRRCWFWWQLRLEHSRTLKDIQSCLRGAPAMLYLWSAWCFNTVRGPWRSGLFLSNKYYNIIVWPISSAKALGNTSAAWWWAAFWAGAEHYLDICSSQLHVN